MKQRITCGVDEAGRGPVIGPMVIACCCFDEKGIEKLRELNVRDSKQISPKRREFLEGMIKGAALKYIIKKISPIEIDETRKKISLNDIEAKKISEILSELNKTKTEITPSIIYVDSPENIQENFTKKILKFLKSKPSFEIISEHYADSKYIEVSAASVLAKVERDREIESLKIIYGDFGSGYPADPRTTEFLKNNPNIPREIIRKSWKLNNGRNKKGNEGENNGNNEGNEGAQTKLF